MKTNIFPAIKLTLLCCIFFSGIYTVIIYGVAQLMPNNGKGEMIDDNGNKYYSNIGQNFTDDKYFYARPSAVDYNAAGSAGSNKGPTNTDYLAIVQARIDTFLAHNPSVKKSEIPSDIVTASSSGLDPNISVQAATIQINRIAKIRNIAEGNIQQLIFSNIEKPLFDFLGPEKINTIKINIALNKLK